MIVYKVMRRVNSELRSAIITRGKYQIFYKENETNYPHKDALEQGYGIIAFQTLKHAKFFAQEYSGYLAEYEKFEIWKGEGDMIPMMLINQCTQVMDRNQLFPDATYLNDNSGIPIGTMMVFELKLIRKIKIVNRPLIFKAL